MKTQSIYSFCTSEGWRTSDIKAHNPKQAYKIACGMTIAAQYGVVIPQYYKYDRDGLASIYSLKSL